MVNALTEQTVAIPAEQVRILQGYLHNIMNRRYKDPDSEMDEYFKGVQNGLEDALDVLGIEHEQWNPFGYLNYEEVS